MNTAQTTNPLSVADLAAAVARGDEVIAHQNGDVVINGEHVPLAHEVIVNPERRVCGETVAEVDVREYIQYWGEASLSLYLPVAKC